MRRLLQWFFLSACTAAGICGALIVAMWVSLDIRYGVVYFLSEHFDLNPPIASGQLARQVQALKRVALVDASGSLFDWKSSRRAIVWVNEWANWCVPCRMEFPAMKALQDRVGKDKLRIVLLSQPRYWAADKLAAKDMGLDFELVSPLKASEADLAATNLAKRSGQFLLPENTFMRSNGNGLRAFHAVRPWDSMTWESIIRHWYEGGR